MKRFIVRFLTTLNPRKPKARQKRISRILLVLIFTTTNLLHVYYLNIASYEILGRINIVLTKPDKGNGIVILDRKLYNNAIEEIISDTSKFEMITLAKILFLLILKLRMQIFPKKILVCYDVNSLFANIPLPETSNKSHFQS